MQDVLTDTVAILFASLVIAAVAIAVILFRPAARRSRRHQKHARRRKIDLIKAETVEPAPEVDA